MIYFIRAKGTQLIKIGYTGKCPDQRLGHLQVGSPIPLERLALMPGDKTFERELHAYFGRNRSHGEWFRDQPHLLAYIRQEAKSWIVGDYSGFRSKAELEEIDAMAKENAERLRAAMDLMDRESEEMHRKIVQQPKRGVKQYPGWGIARKARERK